MDVSLRQLIRVAGALLSGGSGPWTLDVDAGEAVWLHAPPEADAGRLLVALLGGIPARDHLAGEITVLGQAPRGRALPGIRLTTAWIGDPPADYFVCPTVEDEITLAGRRAGWPPKEAGSRLAEARTWVADLPPGSSPHVLAGEAAVRLALACGAFMRPRLWLWQEPLRHAPTSLVGEALARLGGPDRAWLLASSALPPNDLHVRLISFAQPPDQIKIGDCKGL